MCRSSQKELEGLDSEIQRQHENRKAVQNHIDTLSAKISESKAVLPGKAMLLGHIQEFRRVRFDFNAASCAELVQSSGRRSIQASAQDFHG